MTFKVVGRCGGEHMTVYATRSIKNQTGMTGEFLVYGSDGWRWVDADSYVPVEALPATGDGIGRLTVRLTALLFRSIPPAAMDRRVEAAISVLGIALAEGADPDGVRGACQYFMEDGDRADAAAAVLGALAGREAAGPRAFEARQGRP